MSSHKRHVVDEIDGWSDWVQPIESGYRMACCDCGLVHEMEFRVDEENRAQFRARRHIRSTAAVRREMRKQAVQS